MATMARVLSLCLMLVAASCTGVDNHKHADVANADDVACAFSEDIFEEPAEISCSLLQTSMTELKGRGLVDAASTKLSNAASAQSSIVKETSALRGAKRAITLQPTNQTGIMIAPFGKEDTARELQGNAARTQDTLVDAIENAEVAEIKRSVFRALTRLRAAEIKEFDTIARLETQALDEYNDNHHYRGENPLQYISSAEPRVPEDKYISFHD
mmetsp:Transcript_104408/g.181423  ORF Transcript_104408/g.181423 Transcript_104408/m.181423 type:complete len:213 (+) Transcript_104408:62-700(+)